MYTKLKYIILTILLLGIGFGIFSFLKLTEYGYYEFEMEFYSAVVLIGLLIVFFFLPRSLKIKSRLLVFSALGASILFLMITLSLTLTHFSHERFGIMMGGYYALSCEEMENRFHMDKKNNELKFFHFNTFYVDSLKRELKKYGVTYLGMGSLYQENLNCYNKFVADYLKEKENVEIRHLYD